MIPAALRTWWSAREQREQRVLAVGGICAALLLGWAFLWLPLTRVEQNLAARLEARSADLAFMQDAAGELEALRARDQGGNARREGKSLLALADATAREVGLGPALKRLEPLDARRIRIEFAAADFDTFIGWLAMLERDYGIRAEDLSLDRGSGAGEVAARLTLGEP